MDLSRPLTRAQVREFDRLAIEELGIPGVVLMENAGRGAAEAILREGRAGRLGRFTAASGQRVAILCGGGNNGGDGYVVARHLFEAELEVILCESAPSESLSPDAGVFRAVTAAMGLTHRPTEGGRVFDEEGNADLFIDALLGTGFRGSLREDAAGLLLAAAASIEKSRACVVAIDTPSGLDVDSGIADSRTLRARRTLTFAASKIGFENPAAQLVLGEVEVIAIGAPRFLLERVR
jgi:NAD(P)H-hydrate epimerase